MTSTIESSYKQILKATTLFGGVQTFKIFISLVRVKFVAVLLGPSGMGILNLLLLPIGLIEQLTGLGISYSSVREISQAVSNERKEKLGNTISVFKRFLWITGLVGTILTFILSAKISRWTFGNGDYTHVFMFLSIVLLINSLSNGYSSILQGLRKLHHLALSSAIGSIVGLLISLPIYYKYRINGIVPTIFITALITLLINFYFYRKTEKQKSNISWKETFKEGNNMIKLGIFITLGSLISTLVSYLINIYIGRMGGVNDVGLYQASLNITDKSVGLIFAAMATDYYPKLSGLFTNRAKMFELVNHQAEIALLFLGPIVILLITTLPILIRILYTANFINIVNVIPFMILGMPFKTASWAMGFILLAKGNSRLFLLCEIFANITILTCSVIFYKFWGLIGLGFSLFISHFIYFIFMSIIIRGKHHFTYSKKFYQIFCITIIICLVSVLIITKVLSPFSFLLNSLLFIIITLFSYFEINKRISIHSAIISYIKRSKNLIKKG